ncbi:MAG: MFS transporter [Candidatus Baldrarchaeia archaeon]
MSNRYSRNVYILSLYTALVGIGYAVFLTLFPLYLLSLGYSMENLGAINTLANFFVAFIIPFIGTLADHYGRKPLVTLAGLAMATSLLVLGYTKTLPLLIVAYTLMNFSFMAEQPARGAMTAESVTEKQIGGAFGLTITPFFIARSIVPSLSGLMADNLGFNLTFILGGILTSIGVFLFFILSVETLEKEKRKKTSWKKAIEALKPRKDLTWLYIATILDSFAWGMWFTLLNAYIYDVHGLSATNIGFLNTFMFSITFLSQYLAGRWIDKKGYLFGFVITELLGAIATTLLGTTRHITFLFLSLLCIGLSIALWIPSFNNAISLNTEKEQRAREYSKINTYRSFISIPAPYIGGYIYDHISPQTTFLTSTTLLILATTFFYHKLKQETTQHINK